MPSSLPACSAALPYSTQNRLDSAGQLQVVAATAHDGFSFVRLQSGVQLRANGVTRTSSSTGRVSSRECQPRPHAYHPTQSRRRRQPAAVAFTVQESPGTLSVVSGRLRVVADKKTGALTFCGADGQELTRERSTEPSEIKEVTIAGEPTIRDPADVHPRAKRVSLRPRAVQPALHGLPRAGGAARADEHRHRRAVRGLDEALRHPLGHLLEDDLQGRRQRRHALGRECAGGSRLLLRRGRDDGRGDRRVSPVSRARRRCSRRRPSASS